MPQHDMIIDNGSGAGVRADLNNALAALASTQKGPNAPPAPAAGMFWLDDDTPSASVWTLKCYDGADWITIGTFDISADAFSSLAARVLAAALGSAAAPAFSFDGDGNTGIFSPGPDQLAVSLGGAQTFFLQPSSVRLNHASETLLFLDSPGASASVLKYTQILSANEGGYALTSMRSAIKTDGSSDLDFLVTPAGSRTSDRRAVRLSIPGSGPITANGGMDVAGGLRFDGKLVGVNRGTEQATTSGTAIDFTGIPAGVRRITVLLNNVSTNGTSQLILRLGTSGGIVSTGYDGGHGYWGVSAGYAKETSGFGLHNGNAADTTTGRFVIENISGNAWVATFTGTIWNGANQFLAQSAGAVSLAGVLDRLRLTTLTGSPAFDSGSMNIMWEF
jgi:hypothetical protein